MTGVVKGAVANDEEWMDRSRGAMAHCLCTVPIATEEEITKTVLKSLATQHKFKKISSSKSPVVTTQSRLMTEKHI